MLQGRLYIDGKDVFRHFGVFVVSQGWNELISYPPLKPVEQNDWHEEDGVEYDLADPKLDTREISVQFAFAGEYRRALEFIELLSDYSYHIFDCAKLGLKFKLRLVSMPNFLQIKTFGKFALRLADDFPFIESVYSEPISSIAPYHDYVLDGRPLTDYGCRVLKGSLSEVLKYPDIKPNLMRNIKERNGAEYDDSGVTFKAKDVKLSCLMRAQTIDELWQNYRALLFDLVRPNERLLMATELGQSFSCCYKSSSVKRYYFDKKIWLEFELIMIFCGSCRFPRSVPELPSLRLIGSSRLRLTGAGSLRIIN